MKKFIFEGIILSVLLTPAGVLKAQMIDLISNLGVQGQLNAQSVGQTQQAMSMLRQNNIINNLNMLVMSIRTYRNCKNISRQDFFYDLSPIKWDVGAEGQGCYLELKNVDNSLCEKIKNSVFGAKEVTVNDYSYGPCTRSGDNQIKFIFD